MSGRAVRAALLGAAAALLWAFAVMLSVRLDSLPRGTALHYGAGTFGYEALQEIERAEGKQTGEKLSMSAYAQLDGQTLEAKDSGRQAQGSVLAFTGEASQIVAAEGLSGALPSAADARGCALDADTAFRLWGSDRVVGEALRLGGREYTVRGVFRSPKGAVLVPLARGDDAGASVLVVDTAGSADARKTAESFRSRHALPTPEAVSTGAWHAGAARFFALLPALALGAVLLAGLVRELWAIRSTPVPFVLGLAALAAALGLGLYLSGVSLSLPQSLVPTRWSDFSFWQRTLSAWGDNLRRMMLMEKRIPDMAALGVFAQLAAAGTASAALLLLFLRRLSGMRD